MKMIVLLFIISQAKAQEIQLIEKIDGHQLIYLAQSSKISQSCEYDKVQANCLCSLEVKEMKKEWIFRRAKEKVFCENFEKKIKSILSSSKEVKILAYDLPTKDETPSEIQYFGSIKGTSDCFEWFQNDCKKISLND